MQTIKTNGLNLDALKADIANNEIRVLVNGQPETVDFRQWCREMAVFLSDLYNDYIDPKEVKKIVSLFSIGLMPIDSFQKNIYSQLDY